MLDHRLRRWPNIETTSGECVVFAEVVVCCCAALDDASQVIITDCWIKAGTVVPALAHQRVSESAVACHWIEVVLGI